MQSERSRGLYFILISILLLIALFAGCSHKPTDVEIASEVQNKINADPSIPTKQISVGNTNGVVTLSGNVNSDLERIAAANDASQVEGVKTVVNNLQVAPATASAPTQSPSSSPVHRQPTKRSRPEIVRSKASVVTIPQGTSLSVRLI